MGFEQVYVVNGVETPASMARMHAFLTVKGETGVLEPEALKVQGIAGSPGVLGIGPGSGAVSVESRREAYLMRNLAMDDDAVVAVPPNGSGSTITRHVIVEVTDPEHHTGTAGVQPRIVGSLSGLTKPYLYLASYQLAAGAGFDVTTPITDRRRVIMARRDRQLRTYSLLSGDEDALTTAVDGEIWPNVEWEVDIPAWGVYANVIGTWGGVKFPAGSTAAGGVWVRIGLDAGTHVDTQVQKFDAPGVANTTRQTITVGDDVKIPKALRGTTQPVKMLGKRSSGTGMPVLDGAASIITDVEFVEAVD